MDISVLGNKEKEGKKMENSILYLKSVISFVATNVLNGTYEGYSNFLFMSNLTDFELSLPTNLGVSQKPLQHTTTFYRKRTNYTPASSTTMCVRIKSK